MFTSQADVVFVRRLCTFVRQLRFFANISGKIPHKNSSHPHPPHPHPYHPYRYNYPHSLTGECGRRAHLQWCIVLLGQAAKDDDGDDDDDDGHEDEDENLDDDDDQNLDDEDDDVDENDDADNDDDANTSQCCSGTVRQTGCETTVHARS